MSHNPRRKIADPHCPTEVWWKLAAKYPREAIASPLYAILTLESPERWFLLERTHCRDWAIGLGRTLNERSQRSLGADYVEHILPEWEALVRRNQGPHDIIAAVRRWLDDSGSDLSYLRYVGQEFHGDVFQPLMVKSWHAEQEGIAAPHIHRAKALASAAYYCVLTGVFHEMPFSPKATHVGPYKCVIGCVSEEIIEDPESDEAVWQWRRLRDYLQVKSFQ